MPRFNPLFPCRIIAPLLVFFAVNVLHAATYYVSTSGNDANTGLSASAAWKTLDKVNGTTFSPSDRILLHAGDSWTGQLAPQGSGAEGKPIVIDQYSSGNKPVIHGPGTNKSAAVLLRDQSWWEVNNLEVTNSQPEGSANVLRGISIEGTSPNQLWHHIYVRNCYVHDINAIHFGKPGYTKLSGGILYDINIQDALVEGNHVANVAVEGIRNNSPLTTSNFIIRRNVIENVYGDGIVLHGTSGGSIIEYNTVRNVSMTDDANFAAVWAYASRHTLIQFNEVSETQGGGPNDGEVFDADIDTDGDIFQYNYSHDNARGFMLFMSQAKNILVRYNISVNDALGAAPQGGRRLFFQDGKVGNLTNRIYNNLFYTGDLDTVFYQAQNVTFENNILYSTGSVKQFSTTPLSPQSSIANNLFLSASATTVNVPPESLRNNLSADPRWKALDSTDAGTSIGKNGFLQSPKGFALKSGSPALHAGKLIDNNGGHDFYGNPVSATQAPHIGPYNGKPSR